MAEKSDEDGLEAQVQALSEQVERLRAELEAVQETVAAMQSRADESVAPESRGTRDDEVTRSVSEAIGRATNRRQRTRGNVS